MAKKKDFVKLSAVKRYVKESKLRSSTVASGAIEKQFNRIIGLVIVEAGKIARKDKKKTIMPKHVKAAFAKHVGKEDLAWEEILAQVLQETPADLGKISKGIRDHIKQTKK
jgi:histone H3/H4